MCAKFVEAEFEKCDRLMDLFFDYRDKLVAAEDRLREMYEGEPLLWKCARSVGAIGGPVACPLRSGWALGPVVSWRGVTLVPGAPSTRKVNGGVGDERVDAWELG